jgi:hypothetical protein
MTAGEALPMKRAAHEGKPIQAKLTQGGVEKLLSVQSVRLLRIDRGICLMEWSMQEVEP